jgi:hypothetical protein
MSEEIYEILVKEAARQDLLPGQKVLLIALTLRGCALTTYELMDACGTRHRRQAQRWLDFLVARGEIVRDVVKVPSAAHPVGMPTATYRRAI